MDPERRGVAPLRKVLQSDAVDRFRGQDVELGPAGRGHAVRGELRRRQDVCGPLRGPELPSPGGVLA
eukprot:13366003-Alexandrium_andersonii.AAC.1